MSKKITTFSKLMNLIYEKITRSRIIFLIGDLGINLLYYKKNILVESFFCPIGEISSNTNFQNFISKHRKSDAKFIINIKNTNLQHESLPVIGGLGKLDPVEKYCDSHLHPSDLYTYKVYSVEKENAEIWKAVISWLPLTETIERCLDLIKENNITLAGIYFEPVLLQSVGTTIAKEQEVNINEYIYSVISVTSNAGINITMNHGDNILASITCDYPLDKSLEYIQGIIEQNLSDMWLKFKTYTNQNELKKLNIFLLTGTLHNLIAEQTYDVEKSIFLPNTSTEIYADLPFIEYFNKSSQPQAFSQELRSYYRYHVINNVFFKAAYIGLFALCIYTMVLTRETIVMDGNLTAIYNKYFKVSEELRLQSQNFPTINNVIQLADLYTLQDHLSRNNPEPFSFIEDFISLTNNSIELRKISWLIKPPYKVLTFNIDFDIVINNSSKSHNFDDVNKIIATLKAKYLSVNIALQRTDAEEVESAMGRPLGIRIIVTGGGNDN